MADDIVAYLEAQFAKDTRADSLPHSPECNAFGDGDYGYEFRGDLCDCGWPARVLAEVQAKRALLDAIFRYEAKIDGEWGCCHSAKAIAAGLCPDTPPNDIPALRLLAAPFAGEPGFDPSWLLEI